MALINAIIDLIRYRDEKGLHTTLRKIRAHSNIRGNDLADQTAKRVVSNFDDIPDDQKTTVTIGKNAPRPNFWVMYSHKPPPPPVTPPNGLHTAALAPPWWTIPQEDRLHMRAFTRPSKQLRKKVRHALLRSLHYTSLYRRLLVASSEGGTRTAQVGKTMNTRLNKPGAGGTTILKFLHGQLYNGKLAYRYGHAPTDACPLCGLPDSCTHIAGECRFQKDHIISKHNAACQLVHAAIRKAFKGGGTLHSHQALHLISADAGNVPQTSPPYLSDLDSPQGEVEEANTHYMDPSSPGETPPHPQRTPRSTDVSVDVKATLLAHTAHTTDMECIQAPRYIPDWVLPPEELEALHEGSRIGRGPRPDIRTRNPTHSTEPPPNNIRQKLLLHPPCGSGLL